MFRFAHVPHAASRHHSLKAITPHAHTYSNPLLASVFPRHSKQSFGSWSAIITTCTFTIAFMTLRSLSPTRFRFSDRTNLPGACTAIQQWHHDWMDQSLNRRAAQVQLNPSNARNEGHGRSERRERLVSGRTEQLHRSCCSQKSGKGRR